MPMAPRCPQYFLFDLVLWVVLLGLLFGFARWSWRLTHEEDLAVTSFIVFPIGFSAWFIVWAVVRAKRTAPVCQRCGRRFLPAGPESKSGLCRKCRLPHLQSAALRQETTTACMMILGCTTILAALLSLCFWEAIRDRFGLSPLMVVPPLSLGLAVGLFAAIFVLAVIVVLVRNRLLLVEKHALAFARKYARQEGTIERSGPVTIWSYGTVELAPMLLEQMKITRERFERLIDEVVETTPPLRVLAFEHRSAFVAYHRNIVADVGHLDGVYLSRPARMTLATEVTRHRVHDQEATIRALFALYFLEAHQRILPAPWLQTGISGALSIGRGSDSCRHLTRKMKVALSKGTVMDAAEFFPFTTRQFVKSMRGLADHDTFVFLTQFKGQSSSLVEYLAGVEAPADRVGRFRSFLSDLQAIRSQELVFARHFGYGFGALLEGWKGWVREQGLGSDSLPPPVIHDAILEGLVPTIRDGGKKAWDRTQAIRAMGVAGYALGADSLIDLLRDGDDRFTAEATWALESISGLAWGNDPDRWALWWAGLDPKTVFSVERC